jgi:hypothetical protein
VPLSLLILAGLVAALLLCIGYGLFSGYPPPRFAARALSKKEQAIAAACAETLFPERDPMPLNGIEAGVVEYLDAHLADLPADKRFQIRLLLAFIEHGPWIFGPSQRFTALSPALRQIFLSEMATSRFYFRRLCFVSLRTLLCFAYFSNEKIAARVGSAPNQSPFDEELAP